MNQIKKLQKINNKWWENEKEKYESALIFDKKKKNKGVRNREESREGERTRAKVKGKKNKNNKSLKKKAAKSERRWIDQ